VKIAAGVLGIIGLAGSVLVAALPPPQGGSALDGALIFRTQREADYWDMLVQCRRSLEDTEIALDGERHKVATATLAISNMRVPDCPPCACWSDGLLGSVIGAAGGAIVAGGVCALTRPVVH